MISFERGYNFYTVSAKKYPKNFAFDSSETVDEECKESLFDVLSTQKSID